MVANGGAAKAGINAGLVLLVSSFHTDFFCFINKWEGQQMAGHIAVVPFSNFILINAVEALNGRRITITALPGYVCATGLKQSCGDRW